MTTPLGTFAYIDYIINCNHILIIYRIMTVGVLGNEEVGVSIAVFIF